MAQGATSISSLPVNPAAGNPNGNTVISAPLGLQKQMQMQKPQMQPPQMQPPQMQPPQMQPPQMQQPQMQQPQMQQPQMQPPQMQPPQMQPPQMQQPQMQQPQMQQQRLTRELEQARTTKLPPRDIPRNISRVHQDKKVKPNYIPADKKEDDFVKNYETSESLNKKHEKKKEEKETIDLLYDELQAPVLIGFLFFVFQLPIVRKRIATYCPYLFLSDGNMNMSGFVVLSMLFGVLYYGIQHILKHFSTIKI